MKKASDDSEYVGVLSCIELSATSSPTSPRPTNPSPPKKKAERRVSMWEQRPGARAYAAHADKRVFVTDLNVSWVARGRLLRWRVEVSGGTAGDGRPVAVCSPASPPRSGSDPR